VSEPESNGVIRDEKGRIVAGSAPLNPDGRPEGSVSPITRVKQIFAENPDKFKEFIESYIEDPANRKHIVEMIDGKPKQDTDITTNGQALTPLLVKFIDAEPSGDTEGV
jgi:hypothetical protein